MKHTNALLIAAGSVAAAGLLSIAAVGYANGPDHGGRGNGGGRERARNTTAVTTSSIDQTTEDAILHMVEEEKLAHDVYVTLGDTTGLTMFDRISSSESRHESALQSLLDRYDIADPTDGNGVGEFTDPAFTALYDQLVEQGSESDVAALHVGVTIEELDIDDLNARLGNTTPADVAQVFERLVSGSEHHLSAFNRMLAN
jgi:hypothetical protein